MNDPRQLIVFDVNETLLDIDVLEPLFERLFGEKGRMREWFAQLVLYSQAFSLTGNYLPFGELGAGVLRMQGAIHAVAISDAHLTELAHALANLPVHGEVAAALRDLKNAGFRLVTLTNSLPAPGPDSLDKAGLGSLFERRFSVNMVRQFKPHMATYDMVTQAMKVAPKDVWMVAAHSRDTIGAQSSGWRAALLTRGLNAPLALREVPQPALIARDLAELTPHLISTLSSGGPTRGPDIP